MLIDERERKRGYQREVRKKTIRMRQKKDS